MAEPRYWWSTEANERFWVEIRHVPGIGLSLENPVVDASGHNNAWYDLTARVQPGDIVYHWNAREHRFVGRSIVAGAPRVQRGNRIVPLTGFLPLQTAVTLDRVRQLEPKIRATRDQLYAAHGGPLLLPFQFRRDGLRFMSNYFAKMPAAVVGALFGASGLDREATELPDSSEGPDEVPEPTSANIQFLNPFKAKADTEYNTVHLGGVRRHGRYHETLVNDFAKWLTTHGVAVGRNAAVDLGTETPPVAIEAKFIADPTTPRHWTVAIRQAVGQLYEYRFFRVVDPNAQLVFLASAAIPDTWSRYLEHDREIGSAWRMGNSFGLSPRARRVLRVDR